MQRILILLFILAVGAGVFYLIQDRDSTGTSDLPDDPAKKGSAGNADGTGLAGAGDNVGPDALPELKKVDGNARVLLLAKHQGTWPMLMITSLQQMRELEYRTWFVEDINEGGGKAGDGRGMAELKAMPDAQYLLDHDVQAIFLDTVDPNAFPEGFWKVVAERVKDGKTGLYVRPSFLVGDGGEGVSEHPMLTHPVLKELLPIDKAALMQGTPLPGVYPEARALTVTADGKKHPATMLVNNEVASGKAWARTATGKGAYATKFCYPVTELKPGAKVLVEVSAATPVPAIVATDPEGTKARVLWMGNTDFGQEAYHVRSKDMIIKLLVNHWAYWLAGQTE